MKTAFMLATEELEQGIESDLDVETYLHVVPVNNEEDLFGPIDTCSEVQQAVEHLNLCLEQFSIIKQAGAVLASESVSDVDKNVLNTIIRTNSKQNMSTEGFAETLKSTAKRIYQAIVSLFKRFVEFIKNFFNGMGAMRNRLDKLKERLLVAKRSSNYDGGGKIINPNRAPLGYFSADGYPKDIAEYNKNLVNITEFFVKYQKGTHYFLSVLNRIANSTKDGSIFNTLKDGSYEPMVKEVLDILNKEFAIPLGINKEIQNNDSSRIIRSEPLMGCVHLEINIKKPGEVPGGIITSQIAAGVLNNLKIEKVKDGHVLENNSQMFIPNYHDLTVTFTNLYSLVEKGRNIESFFKSSVVKDLDNINSYVNKLNKKQFGDESAFVMEIEKFSLNAMMGISKIMTQIAAIPMSMIIEVCRGGIFVLETSVRAYEA